MGTCTTCATRDLTGQPIKQSVQGQLHGVATLFRVTLFRGDKIPTDKIPSCQDSEETLVRGGYDSEVPLVRGDISPEGTSFRGDIPFKKIPRSLNFIPAGYLFELVVSHISTRNTRICLNLFMSNI